MEMLNKFMKTKKIIFIFMIIFFMSFFAKFVSSVSPFDDIGSFEFSTKGIIIEYPLSNIYEFGRNITFRAKARNQSNGVILTNETTRCSFFFTNDNGNLFYYNNMTYQPNGQIYTLTLKEGNITKTGKYAYGIECDNIVSNYSGFVSVIILVTKTGKEYTEAQGKVMSSIFLSILGLAFLFCIIGYKLSGEKKYIPLSFTFFFLAVALGIYNLHLSYVLTSDILMYESMTSVTEVVYLAILWVMIGISLITSVLMLIAFIRELGKMNKVKSFGQDFNPLTNTYE